MKRTAIKAAAFTRMLKKRATRRVISGSQALSHLATLRELKAEIELLTSYSTDTIYRLRYDTMTYDYISPSITRLLGYQPEEFRQMNIRNLILETRIITDGMKLVESFKNLEESRRKGEVAKWQADYLMRTKDGRKVWISDISYPWFDKRGAIVGSVGSLRDITERVEAEARVREELTRLAHTDVLTGLTNRKVFFSKLEEELRRLKRSKQEFSILLIDIDHFKKVNDLFGHEVGDRVLEAVADIIRSCLRETDTGSRLGGEEFGIILPETPAEGAYWVAERIRSSVAKFTHMTGTNKNIPVGCTVSIGVAGARSGDSGDATQLYKAADQRLYIAKNLGRNQVSMDELEMH